MTNPIRMVRTCAAIIAAGALLLLPACDTVDRLLEAENPGAIGEEQLNDPALIEILVNSVTGELTSMYDDPLIWRGSMFTDEQITGVNWEATARLNLRVIRFDEGDADGMFSALSSYRFIADSVSGRLRNLLEDPGSDARLAQVLAHAGYSYTLMGEYMCEATINVGNTIYSPSELAAFAIPRFEEAIQIGTAAGSDGDDIVNLARVGLARAALLAGDNQKVMSAAAQVSDDFAWWVEYADQIAENEMQGNVSGANHNLGMHPHFLNGTFGDQDLIATQTDPRIQHTTRWTTGHNALTKLYKPYQSLPYSEFDPNAIIANGVTPDLYDDDTDIQLASYVEAMHHYYEAAGPNGTGPLGTTLDFVNSRRAFGHQDPVNLTGNDLMAELREQRGRDLFLGGFRLGDLRRWKANGVGDFFPTGVHPTDGWGPYGDATCYPLPSSEYEGNPNIRGGG
ncbi:MAG: hypothetical protein ACREL7_14385 [Longimicrobiales bacterium]